MTFCRRCGRPLTQRESIARGYGPVCWRILNGMNPPRVVGEREKISTFKGRSLLEVFGPTVLDVVESRVSEGSGKEVGSE
jgi:hypothetical protein